jgi:hypothetical protein
VRRCGEARSAGKQGVPEQAAGVIEPRIRAEGHKKKSPTVSVRVWSVQRHQKEKAGLPNEAEINAP